MYAGISLPRIGFQGTHRSCNTTLRRGPWSFVDRWLFTSCPGAAAIVGPFTHRERKATRSGSRVLQPMRQVLYIGLLPPHATPCRRSRYLGVPSLAPLSLYSPANAPPPFSLSSPFLIPMAMEMEGRGGGQCARLPLFHAASYPIHSTNQVACLPTRTPSLLAKESADSQIAPCPVQKATKS